MFEPSLPFQSLPGNNGTKSESNELTDLDWDFKGAKTNEGTHGYHPYPARFIPQIPRQLILAFTNSCDTVYDPFVGSGTTCVEANIAGRHALGNDINPLSVLLTRVKTNPIPNVKEALPSFIASIQKRATSKDNVKVPDGIATEWFERFVLQEIAIIKEEIELLETPDIRDFCLIALSAIIVSVSKQDSDTRYARIAKNVAPLDTVNRFLRQLKKMLNIMMLYHEKISCGKTDARVGDSRESELFPSDSADFAVASPPYPNAYDYHLYHRHRMLWLGMDPRAVKKDEIGAHAHYSKKNGMTADDFRHDMKKVFISVGQTLKKGKHFALVVGNSIIKGNRIDNGGIVKEAGIATGFEPVFEFTRHLDTSKKSFNPTHGNILKEKIIILRNTK